MENHHTLVTGSNGGIGLYVAEYLLSRGHKNIVFQYRSNNEKIKSVLEKYDLDPNVHLFKADLAREDSVSELCSAIEARNLNVLKLVNVAGSSSNYMSWKMPSEEFHRILNDNLFSTFALCKAFIPNMRTQQFGRIINFSSIVAQTGAPGVSHYCAAKAGIIGLTKSLALELSNKNITCNALALGYFDTGLINEIPNQIQEDIKSKIPLRRFGSRDDVGGMVEFVLSDNANFITGQILNINGGQF